MRRRARRGAAATTSERAAIGGARGALVKPPPFDYVAPPSVEEALAALAEAGEDAKLLAGGQSLVPLLALRLARPTVLVDLGRVGDLDRIEDEGATVTVGAMVRERVAERAALVADKVPLLAAALPLIGHPAIRNRGTVGGSIAHADPAAELPAVAVALDAELVVRSLRGQRTVPAADFFEGFLTTALGPDEALVAVRFPVAPPGTGVAFVEAARRHGDFAMVGAAASVTADEDGRVTDARLVLIGVSDTPLRRPEAEQTLVGASLGSAPLDEAAAAAGDGLAPPSDLHGTSAYRRHLAGVLSRRALAQAVSAAGPAA